MKDAKPSAYRRLKLPGLESRHFFSASHDSLWEAADHLLLVKRTGVIFYFAESYQRFYYDDIQSIQCVMTNRSERTSKIAGVIMVLGGILVGILLLDVIFNYQTRSFIGIHIFFLVLGIPVLAISVSLFIRNRLAGPTCHTFVRIGGGLERIACLGRHMALIRLLEIIGPRVEARQGVYDRETHLEKIRQAKADPPSIPTPQSASSAGASTASPPPLAGVITEKGKKWMKRVAHYLLMALIFSAVVNLMDWMIASTLVSIGSLVAYGAVLGLNLFGLAQTLSEKARKLYRNYHFFLLGYNMIITFVGAIYYFYFIFTYASETMGNEFALYQQLIMHDSMSDPFITVIYMIEVSAHVIFAVFLYMILRKGLLKTSIGSGTNREQESA